MTFRVLLTPDAEIETRYALDNASDADSVLADFRRIGQLLERQPMEVGESREEAWQRVIFVGSLRALFIVDERTATVFILSVQSLAH